jgi:hypothetical protein
MNKKYISNKINKGDTIEYKFTPEGEIRKAVVASKKPDGSGVWINGLIKDKYFIILANEIVNVIETQEG